MPAKILECIKVELHPNADSLRVYNFTDHTDNYQVIANPTNIYEVGDKVVVALIGSVLKDDTEIKESKIRGILSQGMALGKSDFPVSLDVTNDYCHSEDLKFDGSNPQLVRWPSIDNLYNIRKNISEYDSLRKIKYRGKVKIHGCNSAIQIFPNGDIVTQSREQIITPEHDSNGFSRWVNENKVYWSNLKTDNQICIFGEWAGPGIHKGCAIHQLDHKVFLIFAIQYFTTKGLFLEVSPAAINKLLNQNNELIRLPNVFALPFYGPELILNFFDVENLKTKVETINQMVSDVEKEDPFVKEQFGLSGIGEGVVMFPLPDNYNENESILIPRMEFSNLGFKAKGSEHKVVKTKEAAQIEPEVANSISEFITLICTENRLKQQADKVGEFSPRLTGQFLKEFNKDVCKESVAELEASGMTWDQVSRHVSDFARKWWLSECNKL